MTNSDSTPQALTPEEVERKSGEVPSWDADVEVLTLSRVFAFKDFAESMTFANAVANVAVKQNHHPDILISYDTVTLVLTSHDAGGLTDRDFILAAHIDALPEAAGDIPNEHFLVG